MSDNNPDSPIVGGGNMAELSKKQFEDAADDARMLMKESPVIPKLVMADIIARRLFIAIRSALEQEISQGWVIEEPQLVLQTLGMSAQEKAIEEPGTPTEIQQQLLETVIPIMDIFVQMENEVRKHDKTADNKDAQVLPGSDTGSEDEVGAVLRGGEGDPECETGERSQGD